MFYLANNLTLPGQILAGRTERGLACTYPLVILFGIFSLFAAEGHAQGSAASIPVGDARLTPALDVEYVTSDNAFLAPSNEVSSTGVSISPSLTLSADKAQTAFDLSYRGRFAAFDEDELDFADHFLTLNAGQGISRRLRLSGSLGFAREHSDTFTNLALGSAEGAQEQVSFDTLRANASLTYGAAAAKGNVRIGFGLQNRSPNNFESLVGNSGFDSARTFAEFLLRISSDTRFVTGIEYSDVDYDRGATRDREAVTAYVGANFAATGRLSGSLRAGISDVDSLARQGDDAEEFVLNASLQYRPVSYSTFTLTLARDFELDLSTASSAADSESITNRIGLKWEHDWSSRLFSEATVRYTDVNERCPTDSNNTDLVGALLNVYLQRWLILGAGVTVDQRQGELCPENTGAADRLDYDRQRFVVRLRATL